MINREVIYDRNVTGSYMKIPVAIGHEFDEKMMLRRKIPGLLAVERCYLDGIGQYWYNISGKQSLDTYCRIQSIGIAFVEQMIISICSEIEILERNLLDQNCLLLDPEQIFVSNQTQEIIFAIYPGNQESIASGFQQLMEYLLTKIDHKDMDAVHAGYAIYEKTLDEAYSIMDIRDEILARKNKRIMDSVVEERKEMMESWVKEDDEEQSKNQKNSQKNNQSNEGSVLEQLFENIKKQYEEWKEVLLQLLPRSKKEEKPMVVYPEDPVEEVAETIHPTVCLNYQKGRTEGVLIYQGAEQMPNVHIQGEVARVGKEKDAEICIERETISRYHARISHRNEEFLIEDLNSTNGTYVNDEMLVYKEIRTLKTNDVIRFADVKYRFL